YEVGPIRPPSEAASLLIRATRNCPWNKCEFCPTYKGLRFERRPLEEILKDIDKAAAFHGDVFQTAFIQDANSLVMKTDELVEVISHLKEKFPGVRRVTSYARARTVARKSLEELKRLDEAGLSRLHIGLESGYDPLLEYMKKGVTSDLVIEGGKKVVESGISLCLYVVLGLGGRLRLEGEETWRNHALHNARVLSEVNPNYIRVRTLTINEGMPLYEKVESGEFEPSSDAEVVREEQVLIENLDVTSYFASDHSTNVLMDVRGQLPEDKEAMLSIIEQYLELSEEEQLNLRLGTLLRYFDYEPNYRSFKDFFVPSRREAVTTFIHALEQGRPGRPKELVSQFNRMLV
ncbi:MAG: radical SAM protein, partial [Anaerolineae bacterium]